MATHLIEHNEHQFNDDNLPNLLYHALAENIKPCQEYRVEDNKIDIMQNGHLILHLNISFLQKYIDELRQLIDVLTVKLIIILISETRILIDP